MKKVCTEIKILENKLNDFNLESRTSALKELSEKVKSGKIHVRPVRQATNMHFHTFFSYNLLGWSPLRVAWESYKKGFLTSGIVDFDVLDGMEEFLCAGEILGLKSEVGLETRVFIKEWGQKVINSPYEPGIFYLMGTGFWKLPKKNSNLENTLIKLRTTARQRNIQVVKKVNEYLKNVRVDYEKDVIPLTPSGNATERHIVCAYDIKTRQCFPDTGKLCRFWSDVFKKDINIIKSLMKDKPAFYEVIRFNLMKYGGPAYIKPDTGSFSTIEEVIEMITGCEAVPTATWLDGTSEAEKKPENFLSLLMQKGIEIVNIIPDRNWNIKNKKEQNRKVKNLYMFLDTAIKMNIPVIIGTEMNKQGQPVEDNLGTFELSPYAQYFIQSSLVLTGHTILARYLNRSITSRWAKERFGKDKKKRNVFYAGIGKKYSLGEKIKIGSAEKLIRP